MLRVVAGSANHSLANAVASALRLNRPQGTLVRFPDGELHPVIESVRGDDVYVVQPTGRAVNEHLVELLLLLDACRRGGADRVTAVVPYFGYARQDRRTAAGEAVGVRVVADAIAGAGADRLMVVDPHTVGLEATSAVPVEALTAVPVLADALANAVNGPAVVVSPDLGAAKLAERYADRLGLPVAVVRKSRVSGSAVRALEVVGDVEDRQTIIVDDMISTGGTIDAAARLLAARGARPGPVVAATHGLIVGPAPERFAALHLDRLLVTDTLTPTDAVPVEVCSIAALLADAITRLHDDKDIDDLVIHD